MAGSTAARPAIVIVPGSFSWPEYYDAVIQPLKRRGYETRAVQLMSVGRRDGPGPTMAEDAAHIRTVISPLVDQGKDVVLVTHSYGGIPGTESIKDLAKGDREAAGLPGGVMRIIYITSLAVPEGKSLGAMLGGSLPDYVTIQGEYMSLEPEGTAPVTFSDLPPAQAMAWAKKMPEQSAASFAGELTYPGYKYVPVSYLVCEDDKVLPPAFQRSMIEMLEAQGVKVDVHTCSAGHCPIISMPDTVVDIIRKAIGDTT